MLVRDLDDAELVYICMEDRPRGELIVITLWEGGEDPRVPKRFTDALRAARLNASPRRGRGQALQSRQGPVPGRWDHQGRSRRLLRDGGGGDGPAHARPADEHVALEQGHRARRGRPAVAAQGRARVGRALRGPAPQGRRHHARDDQRRGHAALDRAAELHHAARLECALRQARAAGPARVRPRPDRRGLQRDPRGRARAGRHAARPEADAVREAERLARHPRRRAAQAHPPRRRGPRRRRQSSPSGSPPSSRTRSPRPGARRSATGASSSTSPATPTGRRSSPPTRCGRSPGAPVSAPITWDEVADPKLTPHAYTLKTLPERLRAIGDPWADIAEHAATLPAELTKA